MTASPDNPVMRTPAQRRAWESYLATIREEKRAVLRIACDGDGPDGDGCESVVEASRKDARAQGWRVAWRRVPNTGVEVQVDLCPRCSRHPVARRCRLAVQLERVIQEDRAKYRAEEKWSR